MTLVPIGRKLVSADARPLARDSVVDAVLDLKHCRGSLAPDLLDALRDVGPVAVDLVVVSSEWIEGRPILTFGIEDYQPLSTDDIPPTLYRFADSTAGPWWSGSKFDAWREGSGRHADPSL